MKRNSYFLSVALVSIVMLGTSCSQSEEIENGAAPEAIAFSTYVGHNTRAKICDITELKANGFSVFAIEHAGDWSAVAEASKKPNFMYNQAVSWDEANGVYTYSPLKYWPENGNHVSFLAIAPTGASGLSASSNSEQVKVTYTTPAAVADQSDLVSARQVYAASPAADSDEYSDTNDVLFTFDHILSKIDFVGVLSTELQENTVVHVTSLKFYYANDLVGNKAVFDMDTQEWASPTTQFANSTYATAQVIVDAANPMTVSTTTGDNLTQDGKYLMFIPQVYDEGAMYIRMSYEVVYQGTTPDDASDDKVLMTEEDIQLTLPVIKEGDANVGWQKAKAYSYTIEFDLESIGFNEPTVNTWTDGETIPSTDI